MHYSVFRLLAKFELLMTSSNMQKHLLSKLYDILLSQVLVNK